MLNGYVGIVSESGLCRIQTERQESLQRVRQEAAVGCTHRRVGFWAILSPDLARHIASLVDQGEGKEALRLLNQAAFDGGHFLPLFQ